MADALRSSSDPETSTLALLSPAEQVQQANHRLAVVNRELDLTNEQLRVANEQLRACSEEIRAQAAELRRSKEVVQQLNTELTLINAGLVDTIADSLQATEFALAQAEAQRQRLHRLLAQAPAMLVVLTGPDHVVELANDQFRALLGHRELLGKALLDALPELAATPIPDLVQQVYATGQTYVAEELPLQMARYADSPPQEIWWTFTYQARRNAQNTVDGVVVFAADVTRQVQARQAAEASNQHLARINAELDTFVYAASHDLQGPLNNIGGLLKILRGALPAADQSALVARILNSLHDSAGRFQHTLTQLSTIARAQAEGSPPAALVALADVVQSVLLDLALPIAEAGAHVTVDVAACPQVSLPEKILRSVVYNLLSNAVKYRHPDRLPQVCVRCRQVGGFWVLEVQDNGLGLVVPAGGAPFSLFQRFRTHVNGSGVGLYLVQKLVERDGGRLEVASQPGQGSTFTAYFKC